MRHARTSPDRAQADTRGVRRHEPSGAHRHQHPAPRPRDGPGRPVRRARLGRRPRPARPRRPRPARPARLAAAPGPGARRRRGLDHPDRQGAHAAPARRRTPRPRRGRRRARRLPHRPPRPRRPHRTGRARTARCARHRHRRGPAVGPGRRPALGDLLAHPQGPRRPAGVPVHHHRRARAATHRRHRSGPGGGHPGGRPGDGPPGPVRRGVRDTPGRTRRPHALRGVRAHLPPGGRTQPAARGRLGRRHPDPVLRTRRHGPRGRGRRAPLRGRPAPRTGRRTTPDHRPAGRRTESRPGARPGRGDRRRDRRHRCRGPFPAGRGPGGVLGQPGIRTRLRHRSARRPAPARLARRRDDRRLPRRRRPLRPAAVRHHPPRRRPHGPARAPLPGDGLGRPGERRPPPAAAARAARVARRRLRGRHVRRLRLLRRGGDPARAPRLQRRRARQHRQPGLLHPRPARPQPRRGHHVLLVAGRPPPGRPRAARRGVRDRPRRGRQPLPAPEQVRAAAAHVPDLELPALPQLRCGRRRVRAGRGGGRPGAETTGPGPGRRRPGARGDPGHRHGARRTHQRLHRAVPRRAGAGRPGRPRRRRAAARRHRLRGGARRRHRARGPRRDRRTHPGVRRRRPPPGVAAHRLGEVHHRARRGRRRHGRAHQVPPPDGTRHPGPDPARGPPQPEHRLGRRALPRPGQGRPLAATDRTGRRTAPPPRGRQLLRRRRDHRPRGAGGVPRRRPPGSAARPGTPAAGALRP
ncbi:hypothetical protein BZZ08_06524 [Streptomyces sp. MH60]|nr:hypothetical protein BZZ08_06524 [Streptomyces sp. MH60]